jgi:membrane protein
LSVIRVDQAVELLIQSGSTVVIFTAAVLMYVFVPDRRTPLRVAAISAVATAVLWLLAQYLFGFYIQHAVTLKRIYGAYLLVIAVVFWVYYSSLVFILGAEIGQLSRERREVRDASADE